MQSQRPQTDDFAFWLAVALVALMFAGVTAHFSLTRKWKYDPKLVCDYGTCVERR